MAVAGLVVSARAHGRGCVARRWTGAPEFCDIAEFWCGAGLPSVVTRPREPAPTCRELRKTHAKCARAWCLAVRAPAFIWPGVPRSWAPRDCCVLCGVCVVGRVGGPKKRKRGCRRLVAIHGRDGAAAASHEWFRTQETMMSDDAYAPCASHA